MVAEKAYHKSLNKLPSPNKPPSISPQGALVEGSIIAE